MGIAGRLETRVTRRRRLTLAATIAVMLLLAGPGRADDTATTPEVNRLHVEQDALRGLTTPERSTVQPRTSTTSTS